jgi:hypothetical protein
MQFQNERLDEAAIGDLNFEAKMCYYLLEEWLESRRR